MSQVAGQTVQPDAFGADLECVVADALKFKRKLRIGEDAYKILRAKKGLQTLWEMGGVAMTAGSLAASPLVAGTFFASSAGWLSFVGIGVATTPIGWVLAAAAATGGAYYGVTRLVQKRTEAMVDAIPRFINTPIDLLGMQLLDLVGALAIRVASIDGEVAPSERQAIERHFVEDWGYDPHYIARALDVLTTTTDTVSVKAIAKTLAEFQASNPDCNAVAMQVELMQFLRDVVAADGRIDEREELALDGVVSVFRTARGVKLAKVGKLLRFPNLTADGSRGTSRSITRSTAP